MTYLGMSGVRLPKAARAVNWKLENSGGKENNSHCTKTFLGQK